jgi:hypothetical protein
MLENLLGSFIDKEEAVKDTIKDALTDLSEELSLPFNKFFIMIKAVDEKCNFKLHVFTLNDANVPQFVRELTVKEIVG